MIMINDKTNYKKYRYSHRLLPAIHCSLKAIRNGFWNLSLVCKFTPRKFRQNILILSRKPVPFKKIYIS